MKLLLSTTVLSLSIFIFSINSNTINGPSQEGVGELEIRFQPDSVLYVYENTGPEMPKKLFSAVIQNIAFVNATNTTVIVKGASIAVLKEDVTMQSQNILDDKISASAAKFNMYQEQGILDLYDFQFQTSKYLKGIKLATNDTLKPGEGIIIAHETLLFDKMPDRLIISIQGRNLNGQKISSAKELKVLNHKSKNEYKFPLKGNWFVASGPSLIAHHRWAAVQEFAFDFIKVGDGLSSFRNSGDELTDYYAYGEPVFAIGDGVVVSALNDVHESSDNLKKSNESMEDYWIRMKAYQDELMRQGLEYIYGNHVVIKHPNNEYSTYVHLEHNSITISEGDIVEQGQLIGRLGHSGNSTEPHLHFHVSDSPDMFYSRSIPVEFDNVELFPTDNGDIRHLHIGQILKTID